MTTPPLHSVHSGAPDCIEISFGSDSSRIAFNLFWLRDNCPSSFHPEAKERTFDLLSVPDDLCVEAAQITPEGTLELRWSHGGHISRYPAAWLWQHRPNQRRADPANVAPRIWRASEMATELPRHSASAILHSDAALYTWLIDCKRYGLCLVEGLEPDAQAGMTLAKRIGFLRETNFGLTFEVVNKPDPNNLAYTSVELPLHTDLPNQELAPGFQFLHCIANEAQGGASVFADGFAIAQTLRQDYPAAYATLSTVHVPFRFFDREADIRVRRPLISLDEDGNTKEIAYNAHILDLLDLSASTQAAWYSAYRTMMRLTRESTYRLDFKLQANQMVVFDNRRVLHGRQAFDPSSGYRHLRGCYVDRGEVDSRLRMLG